MSLSSNTPKLPDPKIYTIDVSKYPKDERPLRALMHWKKIFPDVKSIRIGRHDETGAYAIAANQFGDRLEVKGLSSYGWNVDYQNWYELKTEDPEIKTLFQEGGKLFKEGHRDEIAMSAKLLGLHYRPWLGNSLLQIMENCVNDEHYKESSANAIARIAMQHVEHRVRELNAGYKINVDPNNPFAFTWKPTTRYGNPVPPQEMLTELMRALPENTKHLVHLTTAGGEIKLPENAYAWKPMSEEQAELMLLNARQQAVLNGTSTKPDSKRDTSYDSLFSNPENFTWVRNGFIQASIGLDMVFLNEHQKPYRLGSIITGVEGSGAVIKDALELLERGRQGLLRLDWLMSSVAPDAITSMAIHLQEKALRLEREALIQAPMVHPNENENVFPKAIIDLQVGDHCAIGSENQVNWCRVKERDGDIAKFWLINGAWAFTMDLTTNTCLPHELNIDLSDMKVLSTAKTPFEGVDSHYNQAIDYYTALLRQQPKNDMNAAM